MSPKNSLLTVGLTALGLFGVSAGLTAFPSEPLAPEGQTASVTAPSPSHTVLLLTNGRVLQGPISEVGGEYLIRQSGGEIRFKKGQVERTFTSVPEVYAYKKSLAPEGDPDEQLKLARWCMTQNLPTEAIRHLETVLKLSPHANQARMMLASLEAAQVRAAKPRLDPALVQTRGEVAADDGRNEPAEIDVAVIQRARKALGSTGIPVIFDLPPAQAIKRAEQFSIAVQPILIAACARCHNENHDGAFQLIDLKKRRRDTGAIAVRANLDATLQFVDPENPSQSPLLSTVLLPHGRGANKRPIFRGSNDPRFQVIAFWVNNLGKGRKPNEGTSPDRSGPIAGERPTGGAFASERGSANLAEPRGGVGPASLGLGVRNLDPSLQPTSVQEPVRFNGAHKPFDGKQIGTHGEVEKAPPSADAFPVPLMFRGTTAGPLPPAANANLPALPGTVAPQTPPAAEVPPASDTTDKAAAQTKSRARPVKIDTDLLQRALQNRNSVR